MVQLRGVGEGGGVESGARSLAASQESLLGCGPPLVSAQHSPDCERPRHPPTSAPLLAPTRAAQVVGPLEQAGDPAGLLGPWRPFGNLTHPLNASPELAGSRELARGSQSFRGSGGSAAVAGCEEGLAEAPGQGAVAWTEEPGVSMGLQRVRHN